MSAHVIELQRAAQDVDVRAADWLAINAECVDKGYRIAGVDAWVIEDQRRSAALYRAAREAYQAAYPASRWGPRFWQGDILTCVVPEDGLRTGVAYKALGDSYEDSWYGERVQVTDNYGNAVSYATYHFRRLGAPVTGDEG